LTLSHGIKQKRYFKKIKLTDDEESNYNNIENFLLLNGADSVEKIDNILITLEEFTDFSNEQLAVDFKSNISNMTIKH